MSCLLLSEKANDILIKYLKFQGHMLIEIKKTDIVYDAVCTHADIYACKAGQEVIIEPTQYSYVKNQLDENYIKYKVGKSSLGFKYPFNIAYNAYCTDKYIIHNLKYTDPVLLDSAKDKQLIPIHTSQGYTKCNIVEINNNSLITSDAE
jgi:hypothetical protein